VKLAGEKAVSKHSCLVPYSFWPTTGAAFPRPDHFPFICRRIHAVAADVIEVIMIASSKCGATGVISNTLDSRNSRNLFPGTEKKIRVLQDSLTFLAVSTV